MGTQEVQYGQYPAIAVAGGQVQLGEDRVDALGHGAVADHERRRLRTAEGSGLHLRKGERGLAELVELGKISAGLDDVDLGL